MKICNYNRSLQGWNVRMCVAAMWVLYAEHPYSVEGQDERERTIGAEEFLY